MPRYLTIVLLSLVVLTACGTRPAPASPTPVAASTVNGFDSQSVWPMRDWQVATDPITRAELVPGDWVYSPLDTTFSQGVVAQWIYPGNLLITFHLGFKSDDPDTAQLWRFGEGRWQGALLFGRPRSFKVQVVSVSPLRVRQVDKP